MRNVSSLIMSAVIVMFSISCDRFSEVARSIEEKSKNVNHYQVVSYELEKKNRLLHSQIMELESKISGLERDKNFLRDDLAGCENGRAKDVNGREVASIKGINPVGALDNIKVDYVNYEAYKWTPNQLLAVAETEFENKNYEKASQFFQTFLMYFPSHEFVDDQFLFQVGVSSYESKRHYNWTVDGLNRILVEYPASKYYRGAKLWTALAKLQMGDKTSFFKTVEEFRQKYRNTPEWKILRKHYEEIVKRYKPN